MPHEPGIYFGLPERDYLNDPALGSSALADLAENPFAYWYESPMNPLRPKEKDTRSLTRGHAMHCICLYGEERFYELYVRGPQNGDDMTPAEKAAATKAAKGRAAASGLILLPFDDYDRVCMASKTIVSNPELKTAFQNGYSEVSVFWERDGIRRRARFDFLSLTSITDLKSLTNTHNLFFPSACYNAIANWSYHVQASHYLEARQMLPKLLAEGAVFGEVDRKWLEAVAHQKEYYFTWIFWAAEGPPLTHAMFVGLDDDLVHDGKQDIEIACRYYKQFMEKFGADAAWLLLEPPEWIERDKLPAWWLVERLNRGRR